MPRNMSFSMTTEAVRNRTKTVTRRLGWDFLRPGDVVCAVEKGMGLKKGEKVKRLGLIRVVSVQREPVWAIEDYADDCKREGFPQLTAYDFVEMFCRANRCHEDDHCSRIEFEYVEDGREAVATGNAAGGTQGEGERG